MVLLQCSNFIHDSRWILPDRIVSQTLHLYRIRNSSNRDSEMAAMCWLSTDTLYVRHPFNFQHFPVQSRCHLDRKTCTDIMKDASVYFKFVSNEKKFSLLFHYLYVFTWNRWHYGYTTECFTEKKIIKLSTLFYHMPLTTVEVFPMLNLISAKIQK